MKEVQWEDYILKGENAELVAELMEQYAQSIVISPDDRLYPGEDYIGNIGSEILRLSKQYNITYQVCF